MVASATCSIEYFMVLRMMQANFFLFAAVQILAPNLAEIGKEFNFTVSHNTKSRDIVL